MKPSNWSNFARVALSAVIALAVAAFAAGCGAGSSPTSTTRSADWNYYDNANNEAPYFGDPEIKAIVADPVYNYADAPMAPGAPDAPPTSVPPAASDSIFVRVLWGHLTYDPSDPGPKRNYSGTMTVTSGQIYILRTVAFEDNDYEITTADTNEIAWHSTIRPAYDGLLIRIDPNAATESTDLLNVEIGAYHTQIALADLASNYLSLEPTGDPNGPNDMVALVAHEISAAGSGFVFGHWRDLGADRGYGGLFRGRWESDSGDLFGHERIRYWPAAGEARGKYIGDDGVLKGRLRGSFTLDKTDSESGTYAVTWYDRAETGVLGHVDGIYVKHGDFGFGFSMGNWSAE